MKKIMLFVFGISTVWMLAAQDYAAFKQYAFPSELCSSASGAKLAYAIDDAGKRNVYVAEAPAYIPRKLTSFDKDEGQEITSLSISDDGNWVVFVRGGEHSGNWETGLPVNASSDIAGTKVQIISVPFAGGTIKVLAEGDYPILSPDSKTVACIKSSQVYTMPIDGSGTAKQLFNAKGNISNLEWSPNGKQLVFVANRGDHSLIGIYHTDQTTIQWLAPSFSRDQSPRWSPDGKNIVFVRLPGSGGAPDSLLQRRHSSWQIFTANVETGKPQLLYTAPKTLRGSVPSTHGGTNLHWAANNKIIFLSYEDGWPHLYAVDASGGKPVLLTPGNYMAEHIQLSTDKNWLCFSANTGNDKLDIERRHIVRVAVDKPGIDIITPGNGIEFTPVITGDGTAIAYFSATTARPPVLAVTQLNSGSRKIDLVGAPHLNPAFPTAKMVVPMQVIFKSADGVEVHADLFEGAGEGRKPSIVYIHGGPPRQMLLGWHYSDYYSNAYASNQYLASLGFNVLSVNYRLGIGYGYEFHRPAKGGAAGAAEYLDIKAAGEWLKKQSFTNPHKIGLYGGSYGGFLTAMGLAHDSKLFAAGVDIHGVHDWTINLADIQAATKYEKAPDYNLALKTAWESSPVAAMSTWKSPVLIIHGDDDRNVRINQSTDLIQRLNKLKIENETILIPDDTHHWLKYSNAIRVYQATADYFIRKFK
ncbi:MAG: S9 family peptidase [Sediminibacterium sp.]|jgi:dipeptidyl aminopeptidase/acylaminoacyl peptidase|nr:S9 family peptidase [Chitinophagaceae bacterium]MCA6446833.1 S9 family peptidase [Chitinophagaceae bacterium]